MMLISPRYQAMNRSLHEASNTFGGSGVWWAFHAKWALDKYHCESIVDYGCGKGSFAENAWRVFGRDVPICEYDPAIPGKDSMPSPADLVVCTDVLEHIEPECIDDVIEHLAVLSEKAALLVISTREAKKKLPDGRNAHLLVREQEWWERRISQFWEIDVSINRADEVVIFARRRTA